jgi:hypothetical protein
MDKQKCQQESQSLRREISSHSLVVSVSVSREYVHVCTKLFDHIFPGRKSFFEGINRIETYGNFSRNGCSVKNEILRQRRVRLSSFRRRWKGFRRGYIANTNSKNHFQKTFHLKKRGTLKNERLKLTQTMWTVKVSVEIQIT